MQPRQIITIGVAVILLLALVGWFVVDRRRSRHLQDHFGSEYDRAVTDIGDRRRAEAELAGREPRVRQLQAVTPQVFRSKDRVPPPSKTAGCFRGRKQSKCNRAGPRSRPVSSMNRERQLRQPISSSETPFSVYLNHFRSSAQSSKRNGV